MGAATVALYVMLGGLRSAIINEVLQFVLIWAGAALIPILGLIEAGGWTNLKAQIARQHGHRRLHAHVVARSATSRTIPWASTGSGIVFGLGAIISLRLLDDRLPRRAARAEREQPARGEDGSDASVRPSRWRCR